MNNYHKLMRKSPYMDTLGRRAVGQMSISLKNTFVIAGGVASALLATAIAFASDAVQVQLGAVPLGASISIEAIRARELDRIMRMDRNEDGKVTFDEFRTRRHIADSLPNFDQMDLEEIIEWPETLTDSRSDWFDLADADGDGMLDRAEVGRAPERIRDRRFQRGFDRLDVNTDGVLNEADVDLRVNKLTAFDDNGDGELSRSELRDVMRLLGPMPIVREAPARAIRIHREYDRRSR